jgi:hypothetical protein
MSRSRKLPLDSPNWWLLGQTLKSCRADPLFRMDDLIAAVVQEQVHTKVEYLDRSTQPARRVTMLLTKEFFECKAKLVEHYNKLALIPRIAGRSYDRHLLAFWQPDLKKIFKLDAERAESQRQAVEVPAKRGPPTVHDWLLIGAEIARRELRSPAKSTNTLVEPMLNWCRAKLKKEPGDKAMWEAVDKVRRHLRQQKS